MYFAGFKYDISYQPTSTLGYTSASFTFMLAKKNGRHK